MLQFVDRICWLTVSEHESVRLFTRYVLSASSRPELSARQERESPKAAQTSCRRNSYKNCPELTAEVD